MKFFAHNLEIYDQPPSTSKPMNTQSHETTTRHQTEILIVTFRPFRYHFSPSPHPHAAHYLPPLAVIWYYSTFFRLVFANEKLSLTWPLERTLLLNIPRKLIEPYHFYSRARLPTTIPLTLSSSSTASSASSS
jgi:hypothetical protein